MTCVSLCRLCPAEKLWSDFGLEQGLPFVNACVAVKHHIIVENEL